MHYIDNACCAIIRPTSDNGIELLLYEVLGRNEANLILQGRDKEEVFRTCFYYTAGSSEEQEKALQDAKSRAEELLMERSEEARQLLKKHRPLVPAIFSGERTSKTFKEVT